MTQLSLFPNLYIPFAGTKSNTIFPYWRKDDIKEYVIAYEMYNQLKLTVDCWYQNKCSIT